MFSPFWFPAACLPAAGRLLRKTTCYQWRNTCHQSSRAAYKWSRQNRSRDIYSDRFGIPWLRREYVWHKLCRLEKSHITCKSLTASTPLCYRAIFNWVSKVIRDYIGFALLRSVIGLENSRHPLNQSDAKLKPIATWSLVFSRAWDRLRVFTLSSHWFVVIFIFVLIGCCDYFGFGFGFSTLNWKLLYNLQSFKMSAFIPSWNLQKPLSRPGH